MMRALPVLLLLVACGDDPPTEGVLDPEIRRVSVEVLPTQALRVTWRTDAPSDSWVRFGDLGAFTHEIGRSEAVTSHEVVVVGVHAGRTAMVAPRSGRTFGERVEVRVPMLPPHVPEGLVVTHDAARADGGWTLTNISDRTLQWPRSAVIYDADGLPVWHATPQPGEVDLRGDVDVQLTPEGTVLIGGSGPPNDPFEVDLAGEVVWRGTQRPFMQHHHLQRLDDGSTILLRLDEDEAQPEVIMDQVEWREPDGSLRWSWSAYDHLEAPPGSPRDFTHLNAVVVHGGDVYVNSRTFSELWKLDRDTGAIVWRLGERGDFALGPGAATLNQHAPEPQPNGDWLVYDNRQQHTRVVRLAVHEEARTAEVAWAFPGEAEVDAWYREDWYSGIWGDADQLANGNVLVAYGNRVAGRESRIFEVAPDGTVVWAMRLPSPEEGGLVGIYRAQRIAPMAATLERAR